MSDTTLRIAFPVLSENPEEEYKNYYDAVHGQAVAVDADCDPNQFDGLLLPGGIDVDPSYYHRENVACGRTDRNLDALQLAVLDSFVKAKKPVFGICRGHQVINVYFGGTLIQHVPSADRHTYDQERQTDRVHDCVAEPGSVLAGLYGERFPTNSAHHQAVDDLGKGLRIVQHSDDGLVEAMEHESLPLLSVQWHPERMRGAHARPDTVNGDGIIGYFLRMCREGKL